MADISQYSDSTQPGKSGKSGNAASGMTARQSQLLAFIQGYTARNGRPPTYEEMKDALGLASKSGIHRLVHALDQRGHIRIGRRASARALIVGEGESVTTPMAISVVLSRCALSEAAERELRAILALSDDAGNWCSLANEARP